MHYHAALETPAPSVMMVSASGASCDTDVGWAPAVIDARRWATMTRVDPNVVRQRCAPAPRRARTPEPCSDPPRVRRARPSPLVRRVASSSLFPLALTCPETAPPVPVHPGSWSVSSGATRSWTSPTSRTSPTSAPRVRPSPRVSSRARIAARRAETAGRARPAPPPPPREADPRGATPRYPPRAPPRHPARPAAHPSPS